MPIFEFLCEKGHRTEHYLSTADKPNPPCDANEGTSACGCRTRRAISMFSAPFTGALSTKYNDSKLEGAEQAGHWAYRVKSSTKRDPKTGQSIPERVWIDTFQAQKEFCKAEGLANPKDVGPMMMGSDGSLLSSRGLPGAW